MVSPKAVCILFQALTALIVTEVFLYILVRNQGLNNLHAEVSVLQLCISKYQLSKTDGTILLKYLLTRNAFSSGMLSSNLSKLCFLNKKLE